MAVAPLGDRRDERRGTEGFLASKETFGNVDYHYDILARRLRELSFLNNGVRSCSSTSAPARRKTSPSPAA